MKIDGVPYRSLWWDADANALQIIDQRWLPHDLRIQQVETLDDYADAIVEMRVRGAPLIGATAAYGMALAMAQDASDAHLDATWERLHATRPTAINLRWALDRCRTALRGMPQSERVASAAVTRTDWNAISTGAPVIVAMASTGSNSGPRCVRGKGWPYCLGRRSGSG